VLNYLPLTASPAPLDPAITTHQLGDGRVVFVSTTANYEWNTLTVKQVFLPLVQELLAGSVTTGEHWMNRIVNQPIEIPPYIKLTGRPTLVDSAKKELPLEGVTQKDGQNFWRSKPIARPGVYALSTGERTYPIAVNIPADEADIPHHRTHGSSQRPRRHLK
jgi:hypothetical protein